MKITVGTFNLNNLFSRFNFRVNISSIKSGSQVSYSFDKNDQFKIRHFQGRLIKPKSQKTTIEIADRIKSLNLDILCVQEVEDIGILKQFNKDYLGEDKYPYAVLIEGNDPRFIDVGLLSRYPIGPITSWKESRYEDETGTIFSRDLQQVEVLNKSRSKKLFTIFNTHLKSNFIPHDAADPEAEAVKIGKRRQKQAHVIAEIIKSETRPNSSFILLGDMNDTPDSEYLENFTQDNELSFSNALENMVEVGEMNYTKYPPSNHFWTHRFNPQSGVYHYNLYDQIWISNALVDNLSGAWVLRRKKVGGDGSDHDPVWIELDL